MEEEGPGARRLQIATVMYLHTVQEAASEGKK